MTHFLYYLREIRKRLIRSLILSAPVLIVCCMFSNQLYHFLAIPLLRLVPDSQVLIATHVTAPFLTPFKLALIVGFFIAAPIWLYQLWGFIAPALYRHERRLVWGLLFISSLLFYCGVIFTYFTVLPLVLGFFLQAAPHIIEVKPDMSLYLDFALKLFFAFGLAFEVPVITVLIIKAGIMTAADLRQKRPYVVIGAFVVGMFMTPPDIISQVLLALPIWILFELGLWLSQFVVSPKPAMIAAKGRT